MAKLQRKSAKVFAESASAGIGGISQFGSLAAGDINYSKDVDVIQALDAYKNGWSAAVTGNKSPAIEDRNALDYLLSYQQAYIMQHGVPEWLSTETYYKNSYVVDSNGELRVSVIDNNTGHDPIEDNGGQYWGYAGARGSGKQIGEVYFSQSKLATDNKGALPLFTGEVISNASSIYPQFYQWVLSHTELCVTESAYQTALSTYGECPFYVINTTAQSIRLPKLTNYIKMANTTQGITQSAAGLPNITGSISGNNGMYTATGSFSKEDSGAGGAYQGAGTYNNYTFAASRSSAVYGNSNTVTPAHTTMYPWVFAFNAAIPASTAQAAEFQEALSSKADIDLSNTVGSDFIVEQYNDGAGNGYRKYKSGAIEQWLLGESGIATWLTPFPSTKYFATVSFCGPNNYSTATSTTPSAGSFGNDIAYGAYVKEQGTTQISWGWNARNGGPALLRVYAIYIPEQES